MRLKQSMVSMSQSESSIVRLTSRRKLGPYHEARGVKENEDTAKKQVPCAVPGPSKSAAKTS